MNWIDSHKPPRNHENAQIPPHFRGGVSEEEIYVHFRAASLNIDSQFSLECLLSPIFSP